jgi:hypothetical protein
MTNMAKSRVQMFGLWCAWGYLALLFIGWGAVAGFLPPTHPIDGALKIGQLYAGDHTRIRAGMLIVMFAALAFIPFAAVISQYIARVERGAGVLTYTFLLGAAGNMCLTMYPALWWLIAAFRPDRAPQLTQLMNDAAWLQFLGGVTIYLAMPLAIAVTSLLDRSTNPPFPRWLGYTNLWLAIAIIPDQLLFFFKTGPFAWNGMFGIWLPIVWFGGFFVINFFPVRRAILRERDAGVPAETELQTA